MDWDELWKKTRAEKGDLSKNQMIAELTIMIPEICKRFGSAGAVQEVVVKMLLERGGADDRKELAEIAYVMGSMIGGWFAIHMISKELGGPK